MQRSWHSSATQSHLGLFVKQSLSSTQSSPYRPLLLPRSVISTATCGCIHLHCVCSYGQRMMHGADLASCRGPTATHACHASLIKINWLCADKRKQFLMQLRAGFLRFVYALHVNLIYALTNFSEQESCTHKAINLQIVQLWSNLWPCRSICVVLNWWQSVNLSFLFYSEIDQHANDLTV